MLAWHAECPGFTLCDPALQRYRLLGVRGHPGLQKESEANLRFKRLTHKQNKTKAFCFVQLGCSIIDSEFLKLQDKTEQKGSIPTGLNAEKQQWLATTSGQDA